MAALMSIGLLLMWRPITYLSATVIIIQVDVWTSVFLEYDQGEHALDHRHTQTDIHVHRDIPTLADTSITDRLGE